MAPYKMIDVALNDTLSTIEADLSRKTTEALKSTIESAKNKMEHHLTEAYRHLFVQQKAAALLEERKSRPFPFREIRL